MFPHGSLLPLPRTHTNTLPSPTMHDVLAGCLAGNEAVCEANLPLSECGWHRGERSRLVPHWRWRALHLRGGGREGGREGGETGGYT